MLDSSYNNLCSNHFHHSSQIHTHSSDGRLSAGVGSWLPLLRCPIETFRQLLFSYFPKAQRNVRPSFMGNFESASFPIEEVPNFTFGRPSSSEMLPKHSGGVLPSCQLQNAIISSLYYKCQTHCWKHPPLIRGWIIGLWLYLRNTG